MGKALQKKLAIGSSRDPLELEADHVADHIVRGSEWNNVSTSPIRISRATLHPQHAIDTAPPSVDRTLSSVGAPLDERIRSDMEGRFGHDFADVRIHTDATAAQSARDVHANAYTVGRDIVFGSGRYAPNTLSGRHLLAHELTHVVQQTQPGTVGSAQRQVQRDELKSFEFTRPTMGNLRPDWADQDTVESFEAPQDSYIYWWSFEGEKRVLPCPGCHQKEEQHLFKSFQQPTKWTRVQLLPLCQWALNYVWDAIAYLRTSHQILSLLQRQETDKLHAIFDSYRDALIGTVRNGILPDKTRVFEGSDEAKKRWSEVLRDEWEPKVKEWLHQRAVTMLVEQTEAAALVASPHSDLVTDPDEYARIEDHPDKDTINIGGPYNVHAGVGFEWLGRSAVSVTPYVMHYHVLKHPRIYFSIDSDGLNKAGTFAAKVFGDVAKAAEGIAVVGSFVKGVFGVFTGAGEAVIDAGAKLIDMQTQFVAVVGEATGWYHVGYSCLSSTCKQYQAGVKQSELIMNALGDATVIVPLIKQAKECIGEGNAEACGGLAGAAFMGIFSMKSKASRGIAREYIRDKINRPSGQSAVAAAAEDLAARGRKRMKAKEEAAKTVEREKILADEAAAKQAQIRAKSKEQLRTEEFVHTSAKVSGAEVKMGNETHGVAAQGSGPLGGFQLCTNCALCARKLAELEKILPEGSTLKKQAEFLRKKAEGYDASYRKGEMSKKEMKDRAANELANDLRKDIIKDPLIEKILDMTLPDLKKSRAKLRKEAAANTNINNSPAAIDARNAAAAKNMKGRVEPKTTREVDKAFKDDLESWTPGKTSNTTAPKNQPLKQDHSLNVDEIKAVGEPNTGSVGGRDIPMKERRERAVGLDNREFKEAVTNQKSKGAMLEKAPARNDAPRPAVSLLDDHGALFGRKFSEIKEVNTIGERIRADIKGKTSRRPGSLKEEFNRKLWDEFKDPKTNEGRIVAEAIEKNGFGLVKVGKTYVLRMLTDAQLKKRGLTWVDGRGYVRPPKKGN